MEKYARLDAPWSYFPEQRNFSQISLNFSDAIGKRTFYNLSVGYLHDKSDKSDNYGVASGDNWDDTDTEYTMNWAYVKRGYNRNADTYESKVLSLTGDITSQVTNSFQLKGGAEFRSFDMKFTHAMMQYEGGERGIW